MARIRTIKPEFWSDEKLAPLPVIDRLVFLGLVSQADDAGRLVDNARLLDGLIFPETEDSCAPSLAKLAELGRIIRYLSSSGQKLIQITSWERHQKVKNPSPYTLPAPPRSEPAPPPTEDRGRVGGEPTEGLTPLPTIPDLLPANNDLRPTAALARVDSLDPVGLDEIGQDGSGVPHATQRMSASALLHEWEKRQPAPIPACDRAKHLRMARTITDGHTRAEIAVAFMGMGQLFPHSDGQPWDLSDLGKKFQKATAAARDHPEIRRRNREAELMAQLESA